MKASHAFASVLLASASMAQAAVVLYSDPLTGTGDLNGVTVATSVTNAGATTGAQWVAYSTNKTASGAQFAGSNSFFLPFTPTSGNVYTFTATLNATSTTWTAIGFANASTNGLWHTTGGSKYAWALDRNAGGGAPQFFGGAGATNGQTWTSTADGLQTVAITLDTTTSGAWKTFATISGVNSNTYTYGANPSISFLGFGTNGGSGTATVKDFSLTAIVPEPASLGVLALGSLGLLARRRRV